MRALLLFCMSGLSLVGCSGLFLHPDRANYFPEAKLKIVYEEGFIPTEEAGEKLHYWVVPAQLNKVLDKKPKGVVVQVHGNAQNLTAHVGSLGWLTAAGYHLIIFDYRGFGQSTGSASLGKAYQDVQTALDHIAKNLNPQNLPIFFYGQSLGGTLLAKAVSSSKGRWHPRMIVIESSFFSYPGIAREKMASTWFTWPFQWMAYLLITDLYSLRDEELATLSPTPTHLFYSEQDPIVPIHHGRRIFEGLREPKAFHSYPDFGHINSMWVQEGKNRKILLDALEKAAVP